MMNDYKKLTKLIDLCGRLPYGLKVDIGGGTHTLNSICDDDGFYFNILDPDRPAFWEGYTLDEIKPYLFPMSSMTEEQLEEAKTYFWKDVDYGKSLVDKELNCFYPHFNILEFYHKYHIDYRGLIDSGDALDATNLGIY